ncbi:Gp15 family bacteriophage protein [Heyndrickxia ginsengihumi]|uniref:Gp15 family bacteriophage protein n=1 Tax=Heyndrickxia ginsengihumi TaxID=363870 RepID=UPI003D1E05CA
MKLTDRFKDSIQYGDHEIYINLAFDIVLRSNELIGDNTFSPYEKIEILFDMFVIDSESYDFSFFEKNEIVQSIFRDFLELDTETKNIDSDGKKYFDLEQDAEYIYASFLQDYNIDLFEMQGVLHWNKFLALLGGLSEKTKFVEVVNIRQQKVPQPTKYNKEERESLIKLKRIYALKDTQTVESIESRLDALAMAFKPKKRG